MKTVNFRNKHGIPFYAWDCLTIQLKHRDVDLIIRKESQMMMLIKFLCYKINSCDGQKNTGVPIYNKLLQNCFDQCSYK